MQTLPTSVPAVPYHKGLPLVGTTFSFISDPLGFILTLQEKYPRLATINLLGRKITVLQTADDAKHVLQENNRNYHKSEAYKVLAVFLGNGLLTSEGEFWRRQRKLAQPAFYKQRLTLMADMMVQETEHLLTDWKAHNFEDPRSISQDMLRLTLNIVTKALFSTDVGARVAGISEALDEIMHYADEELKSFIHIPLKYATPRNVRFRKAVSKVEAVIYGIINGRRSDWQSNPDSRHDDLLDMLMHTRDEETGETMSDAQLRDEVTTIFMAGHETTANALVVGVVRAGAASGGSAENPGRGGAGVGYLGRKTGHEPGAGASLYPAGGAGGDAAVSARLDHWPEVTGRRPHRSVCFPGRFVLPYKPLYPAPPARVLG